MNNCYNEKMLDVEQVLEILKQQAKSLVDIENIDIKDSLNRILAVDVTSKINIPPQDNSAMDGFAFKANLGQGLFTISQRIPAGTVPKTLEDNTVARIFTGAFIPQGADCVVIQEECEIKEDKVNIFAKATIGQNIRRKAEDVKIGDIVLEKGQRIRPQDMGMLASVGLNKVSVFTKPTIAFFSTGDEIVEPNKTLKLGQIYNSNRYILIGLLKSMNVNTIDFGIVPDNLKSTEKVLKEASEKADIILSTGGVSVGEEDYVKTALQSLGELKMYKVKMKPGKPFTFGKIKHSFFLGLPGNPVSTFVVFNLFVRPFINSCINATYKLQKFEVIADFTWQNKGVRREYARAKIINNKAVIYKTQSSGVLTSTVWSDGFVCIMENTTIEKGDKIKFIPFNQWNC